MGMSTHVKGFRPPDEKWRQMEKVYSACMKAGIEIPEEVEKFFDYEEPDECGVEVEIKEATCEWCDDSREGFEIDLKKLPSDVTIIRFYNSY
jgi:hypothetical protein